MPINPQIPLAVQQLNIDPMQQMGKALSLKHMMAQTNALDAQNQRQQQLAQLIRSGARSKDLMQAGFMDEAAKLGTMEQQQFERSRQAAEDAFEIVKNSPDPQRAWQEQFQRLYAVVEDKEAFLQNFPREWNEDTQFMVMLAAAPEEDRPRILAMERERRLAQQQQGMAGGQAAPLDPRDMTDPRNGFRSPEGTINANNAAMPETAGGMWNQQVAQQEGTQPQTDMSTFNPGAPGGSFDDGPQIGAVGTIPQRGPMSSYGAMETSQTPGMAATQPNESAGLETSWQPSKPVYVPQQSTSVTSQPVAQTPVESGPPTAPQLVDDPVQNTIAYNQYQNEYVNYLEGQARLKETEAARLREQASTVKTRNPVAAGEYIRQAEVEENSAKSLRERARKRAEDAGKMENFVYNGEVVSINPRFGAGLKQDKQPLATATASASSKQEGKSEVDLAYEEAIKAFDVSRSVRQSIPGLQSLWDLSNDALINLGPGADALQFLDRLADRFGGGEDNKERIANTRRAMQQFAQFTLDARGKLKGQGQISDKETQLLVDASSGKIGEFTAEEIKALVGALAKVNLQAWDEANEALDIEIQLATPSEGNPGKPLLLRRLKAYKERLGTRPNIVVRKGKIKQGPNAGKTAVMYIDGTISIIEGDD